MRGRSLLLIKPDAVQRNLTGKIISRIESARFKILAMKMVELTYDDARRFYAVHEGRPFLEELCQYMSSGPIVAMARQLGWGRRTGIDLPFEWAGRAEAEQDLLGSATAARAQRADGGRG